jgi:hypothetical protein
MDLQPSMSSSCRNSYVLLLLLPYNPEEELVSYCLMMERKLFGLSTRSVKRIAFELAIKMVLPVQFQYKEQQAGSGCVAFCAAVLD